MSIFRTYIFVLICMCVVHTPAFAADVLHLRNGDKLTGSIVRYTAHQVDISTKYGLLVIPIQDLGEVNTPNRDIRTFIEQAIVLRSPPAMKPSVASTTQTATPEDSALWGAKWSGNANVGAGMRTGNSETSNVNADINLTAKWKKHRASLKTDLNREEDDGKITVDNRSLELNHDYFFIPKWFMETSVRLEQDDIDLLDLRTIGSLGLGHQPYDEDDLSLKYVLGPGILDEKFEDGSSDRSLTAQWSFDYSQKFYGDFFRLFHEHDVTAPIDNVDGFLFQSESGIRIPLRRGIVASAQVDFDFDNDSATGIRSGDTIYLLRLGYEWN